MPNVYDCVLQLAAIRTTPRSVQRSQYFESPEAVDEHAQRGTASEAGVCDDAVELALRSGRRVMITRAPQERIALHSEDGALELQVRVTPDGLVLNFGSAALVLSSESEVRVECQRFSVEARSEVSIHSRGTIAQEAEADFAINGERILLNC